MLIYAFRGASVDQKLGQTEVLGKGPHSTLLLRISSKKGGADQIFAVRPPTLASNTPRLTLANVIQPLLPPSTGAG